MDSTPAFNAFSATDFPTNAAISTLEPLVELISLSLEEAALMVAPLTSSTN